MAFDNYLKEKKRDSFNCFVSFIKCGMIWKTKKNKENFHLLRFRKSSRMSKNCWSYVASTFFYLSHLPQAQAQLASANPEAKEGDSETTEESEMKEQAEKSVQELSKALDTPKAIIHPYDYKGSLMAKENIAKQGDDSNPDEPDGRLQTQEVWILSGVTK